MLLFDLLNTVYIIASILASFKFFYFFYRFAGYEVGSCLQPGTVTLTLKVLVSPVPVVLILVGLLILRTYPIDEERRLGNRKELQQIL